MSKEIKDFRDMNFSWETWRNKLAPYTLNFKSKNNYFSKEIEATCGLDHYSDIYHIRAVMRANGLQKEAQLLDIWLDDDTMAIILDFIERLTGKTLTSPTPSNEK